MNKHIKRSIMNALHDAVPQYPESTKMNQQNGHLQLSIVSAGRIRTIHSRERAAYNLLYIVCSGNRHTHIRKLQDIAPFQCSEPTT